ncbi:MAG: ECF-type sigma factor [Phycisphaerae bacterium]|nr:ECF-type sigma factor [Phycisphaerae bacterium]
MPEAPTEVTSLLSAVGNGDAGAADRLMRVVYDELHQIAHARMAEEGRRGDLQTTVVVHEAYLRLMGGNGSAMPQNRQQFFGFAANAMRQFLVDHARKRGRQKRGGGRSAAELLDRAATVDDDPSDLLAVDEALSKLAERDPKKAKLVELRFFAGLRLDDVAEAMGVSPRQIDQEWAFASAWLRRELS